MNMTDEKKWCKEWGGEIFFCHGSTYSKGGLIFIHLKSTLELITLELTIKDSVPFLDGRIV